MREALRTIFVVFKTHFDIGFTGLVEEVLGRPIRPLGNCRQDDRRPRTHPDPPSAIRDRHLEAPDLSLTNGQPNAKNGDDPKS